MDKITKNLRKISYGLYAIGAMDGNRPVGCIVNTVFQITSSPAIIATSINKDNFTYEVINKTKEFTVNIISENTNRKVITQFGFMSGRDKNKYEGINYEIIDGLPVIKEEIAGVLRCKVVSMAQTDTHFVILALVEDSYDGVDTTPMTYKYYHEVIKGNAPKNAPSYVPPEKLEENVTDTQEWVCDICGYVHKGPLPKGFVCPICGVDESYFKSK